MTDRAIEILEEILAELRRANSGAAPARPASESVSIDEAATSLGCSRTRVFELLRDGTLQRARRIGRHQMILASSVEAARREPSAKPVSTPRRRPARHAPRGGEAEVLELLRESRARERQERQAQARQRADRQGSEAGSAPGTSEAP